MTPPPREVWQAPAKINLRLAITGRRSDGYHTVDTVYQAIDLCDTVVLESSDEPGVRCVVDGAFAAGVPEGDANLAARAARVLGERTGHDPRVTIRITKRIPSGAGLGGGSSDAAAVLLALGRRFAVPDPEHNLRGLAAELGADVPFFLLGGTQRGRGIGDELEPAEPPAEPWGILVWPGVPVSSAWAYAAYDAAKSGGTARREDGAGGEVAGNAFEPIVYAAHPSIREAAEVLRVSGGAVPRLAGSGGALFSLYSGAPARDLDLKRVLASPVALTGYHVWPFHCVGAGVSRMVQ
ncbi:MAG: 4-(cytidine 5'-diphospho)-2-C-methyl-D-erythritol kinase [Gemmatimonadota bacterium]